MAEFVWPDWLPTAPDLPPPAVDADRIEGLTNRFIAASQGALHTEPDAFFSKAGADAVEGAPAVVEQLSGLRDATLDLARDEPERQALADRLDRYHGVALDDIDRHVAEQRQVRARQTIADRQALNLRAAGLKHNEDVLPGLAEAHAQAARALARLDGIAEEPAMQAARSAVWRAAIDQRLADGEGAQALDLFEQAKDTLVPADQRALEVPIEAARTDAAADQWIAREAGKDGEPPATRPSASLRASLQADTGLSPVERATVLAKIEARDSAKESARVATVKGLDDRLGATTGTLATQPAAYRPGTLAAIANAYDDAGESDKADTARHMALQESFLLPFARSGAATQQRLIDSLPDGEDRTSAEAIQARQNEAFAKDAFSAGTALYPDVGPPKPIDDLAGRIAQARTIAAYRGIPVAPLTADEISALRRKLSEGTPQEREALLAQLNSMSKDMKAAVNPSLMASDGSTPKDTKLVPANYTASDDSQQRAEIGQDGAAVDVAQAKPGASPQTTPAQQKPPQVPAAPNSGGPNVLPPTPAQRNRNTLDNWARIPGSRQKTELPMPEDWRGRLPPAILDAINKEAETYGVPPELLARILWKESTFNEKAGQGTRKQGQGIAGISKDAINQLLKNNENNPERKAELERYAREDARMQALPAISMAAEYLRHNFDRLGRSWVSAVAGYTAGETRIRRFLQGQPEWRDAGLTKGYLSLVFDGNASRFDSYQ